MSQPYLPPQDVAHTVLQFIAQSSPEQQHLSLQSPPRLLSRPWSTVYFLDCVGPAGLQQLVVKIGRFPDQITPELSWQSPDMLMRCRHEYESMSFIHEHFSSQPHKYLRTIQPRYYMPTINAIVMDYVPGPTLYAGALRLRFDLSPQGRRRSEKMLHRAGEWLRWFHQIPQDYAPDHRVDELTSCCRAWETEAARLAASGINVEQLPDWSVVMARLRQMDDQPCAWIHGDFHLGNIFILPDDSVVGFDIALDKYHHPYYDLGKLLADLKTRRSRILRQGLLPSDIRVQQWADAFLAGYFGEVPSDNALLLMYEGQFILQKWADSLDVLRSTIPTQWTLAAKGLEYLLINKIFMRIFKVQLANIKNSKT